MDIVTSSLEKASVEPYFKSSGKSINSKKQTLPKTASQFEEDLNSSKNISCRIINFNLNI